MKDDESKILGGTHVLDLINDRRVIINEHCSEVIDAVANITYKKIEAIVGSDDTTPVSEKLVRVERLMQVYNETVARVGEVNNWQ